MGFEQLCIPDQWNPTRDPPRLLGEAVEHGYVDSICLGSHDEWFAEHVGHGVDLWDGFVVPGRVWPGCTLRSAVLAAHDHRQRPGLQTRTLPQPR